MSTSRQRLWEISDLLVDVSKAIDTLVSGDPYVDLRIWSEKAAELKHYASELVCISGSIRQQDEKMAVMQGRLNHISPGPCKNGMINTEAENANRDDVQATARDEMPETMEELADAEEIEHMRESEIDKALQDDGVDPVSLVERVEKKIRKRTF
jgi:hypothetical protein